MICFVLRVSKEDIALMEYGIKDEVAFSTDETCKIQKISGLQEMDVFLQKKENVDIICVDVSEKNGIEVAEKLRQEYTQAPILVIAEVSMSPVLYIKPQIMASSLLLKPLKRDTVQGTIKQMIALLDKSEKSDGQIFVIENKDEKIRIPYNKILYFEARMKKIYVCTESKEFGFYDTMDHLESLLGEVFSRSHRGYIVNSDYITGVFISQGIITLKGDIEIPLSRSYKSAFKDVKQEIDIL